MTTMRTRALSFGLAVVAFGATTGSAIAADNSVTAAIKAQDKIVQSDPVFKDLKHFKSPTTAQAMKLVGELGGLHTKIESAATAVSKAAASTPAQKQGQKDWVQGARELASGLAQLQTGLRDALHGNQHGSRAAIVRGEKLFLAGNKLGAKGDMLLGLPASD